MASAVGPLMLSEVGTASKASHAVPPPVDQQRRQDTGDMSYPSGPIALDVESVVPSHSVEKSSGVAGRERPGSPEPGCSYVHNVGEGNQSKRDLF